MEKTFSTRLQYLMLHEVHLSHTLKQERISHSEKVELERIKYLKKVELVKEEAKRQIRFNNVLERKVKELKEEIKEGGRDSIDGGIKGKRVISMFTAIKEEQVEDPVEEPIEEPPGYSEI
ncbi:hypothetical protein TrLO_g13515 [Triparma laevis f. longispina]|uniref:Uncharacterized protein n=1 Tax=Triparma laevis f. longispina TaxID=1714387 RepID=A0A9W7FS84_9STRA|nr:hypothetical protein TrLO_g13515 [Triparma laevis f. longispina]